MYGFWRVTLGQNDIGFILAAEGHWSNSNCAVLVLESARGMSFSLLCNRLVWEDVRGFLVLPHLPISMSSPDQSPKEPTSLP